MQKSLWGDVMATKKRYLVLGMGLLGQELARRLAQQGHEVVGMDRDVKIVEAMKDSIAVCSQGDVTDIQALEEMGAKDVDVAIVCVGEHLEANILATAHLLQLGCKYVAARANSPTLEMILKRIGAHEVFVVEQAVGRLLAERLG